MEGLAYREGALESQGSVTGQGLLGLECRGSGEGSGEGLRARWNLMIKGKKADEPWPGQEEGA